MKSFLNFARVFGALLLAALIVNTAWSQPSADAVTLTLRIQEGIKLDTVLATSIDSGLAAARQQYDTLRSIYAWDQYVPNELLVRTDAAWSAAWRQGNILTGEPYIDSLGTVFGLAHVDTALYATGPFELKFAHPLQMRRLGVLYKVQRGVQYAEPNGYGGDGDDISFFRKRDTMYFVFSKGWGDCPSGCMDRFYWYVTVARNNGNLVASIEEQRGSRDLFLSFCRWNIPSTYAAAMFPDADSILHTISLAPQWWVRRHAIEVTWRFFTRTTPWVSEEQMHWQMLRDQLHGRRADVLTTLQSATFDPDSDVSASARNAVSAILATSVVPPATLPQGFALAQNYPNPFNPSTVIRYQLSVESYVRLSVSNLLGQEIRELADGIQQAGEKTATFDATGLPSGMYFYRLDATNASDPANHFTRTRRMMVVK